MVIFLVMHVKQLALTVRTESSQKWKLPWHKELHMEFLGSDLMTK